MININRFAVVGILFLLTSVISADVSNLSEKIKDFLTARVDKAIAYLEYVKLKVDTRKEFTGAEKEEIKSNLNGYINYFKAKKNDIENAKTIQDLKIIVKDLREKWKEVRAYRKSLNGLILVSRFREIAVKAKNLSKRIELKISELNVSKENKTKLMELNSKFKVAIELMEDKALEAREKFKLKANKAGYSLLMDAKSYLRDAFHVLRDIVRGFRELKSKSGK